MSGGEGEKSAVKFSSAVCVLGMRGEDDGEELGGARVGAKTSPFVVAMDVVLFNSVVEKGNEDVSMLAENNFDITLLDSDANEEPSVISIASPERFGNGVVASDSVTRYDEVLPIKKVPSAIVVVSVLFDVSVLVPGVETTSKSISRLSGDVLEISVADPARVSEAYMMTLDSPELA